MKKILVGVKRRKKTVIFILIVLIAGSYFVYQKTTGGKQQISYVFGTVTKGALIASVSGSGQIAVSDQVDVKAKVSGDLYQLNVVKGQEIKTGDVIARLDAADALKSVRDAQANLESAQLSLEKLQQPADALTITQAENSLAQAKEAKTKAEDNINNAYDDAFNAIANAFLNFPTIVAKLNDVLYSTEIAATEIIVSSKQTQNISALLNAININDRDKFFVFQNKSENDYNAARVKYDINFEDYKNISRYSDQATIEALLNETLETSRAIAEAVKSESNYLDAYSDFMSQYQRTSFAQVKTYQSNLATYISQTNSSLSSLLAVQRSLQDNRDAVVNADRSIAEKEGSLANLRAGADPLDLKSQQLSLAKSLNSVRDAQEKLADYTIRAPFDGLIAALDIKKGDSISSGAVITTVITKQKIAEISLNEVDAAKVKVGQKTTLTFDAVQDLSLTGQVADIDTLGAVSQGVVTYNVKIVFDTQDDRIKPGMSVVAAIITDVKTDVLLIENSAIKTDQNGSYVEAPDNETVAGQNSLTGVILRNLPVRKNIQTGLANDTSTEVISGLNEGDTIIVRTVASSSVVTASSGASIFQAAGAGSRGGFISGGTRNFTAGR